MVSDEMHKKLVKKLKEDNGNLQYKVYHFKVIIFLYHFPQYQWL